MIVKMREVVRNNVNETFNRDEHGTRYIVRDIFLNPDHVQMVRPNEKMKRRLHENAIDGISRPEGFCTISLSSGNADIIVVGTVNEVHKALLGSRKLLNG